MIRIVALNNQSKEDENNEDETITQVTKEAQVSAGLCGGLPFVIGGNFSGQETIVISEYCRALSLKQNGNASFALGLFEDLLRTQVLSDVSKIAQIIVHRIRNSAILGSR